MVHVPSFQLLRANVEMENSDLISYEMDTKD